MSEILETADSKEWFNEALLDENPSRLSGIIFFLLCAMPVFSAVAFGGVDAWAFGLLTILTGLIVILWITDAFFKKEFQFNSNALQIPLFGLILIGSIQLLPLRRADISNDLLSVPATAAVSLSPYSTRFAVVQMVVYFIFFAAALVFVNSPKRLRKTVLTVVIFGSAIAFFGIIQRLANPELIYGLRAGGFALPFASFINQHHFAAFMEMTIGLTLGLLFGKSPGRDKKFLLMIAVVLMGIAILMTGSRGGLLSLVGVLGFITAANLLERRKKGSKTVQNSYYRNFAFIAGILALFLGLFGLVILLGSDELLLRGVGLQNVGDFSTGRTHFWKIAVKIFLEHPILGAGFDAFGAAFTQYDTWNGIFRVEQTHNDYLQIMADAGLLGLVCIIAFIYLLFKKSLQNIGKTSDRFRRDTATGALAGCFGILIHSFFDFPLRTPSNMFFFLLLTTLATVSIIYPKSTGRRSKRKLD